MGPSESVEGDQIDPEGSEVGGRFKDSQKGSDTVLEFFLRRKASGCVEGGSRVAPSVPQGDACHVL